MELLEEDMELLERYHLFKNDLLVMWNQAAPSIIHSYREFSLKEILRLFELIKRDTK